MGRGGVPDHDRGPVRGTASTQTGGKIVYLIDDPAIHLTLAENLAHHGTWGVVPGTFQSASSSPLWTLLLSGFVGVASGLRAIGIPLSDRVGPLVLNVAAGLWVINLLANQQRVLLPSLRRPFDALGTVALAVYVLFLPALTLLGMEHVLQMALVLSAVTLFQRKAQGHALGWPGWLPYVLVALATLVRFEDLFVVAGLAVGFMAMSVPGLAPATGVRPWRDQLKQATLVVVAAAVPFLGFVAFNKLMGQGLLPNSVLAKGQGVTGTEGNAFQARVILNRLTSDPMLGAMAVLVAGALMVGWRQQRRYTFPAIAFLVATGIHVTFAQVGWYERYQAYLIALGVLVLLAIADEVVPSTRRPPARAVLVPMLVLVALLLGVTKISLTTELRTAVQDTYQQRYQAGRFLGRYYDGEPVATGELGYISLEHDGPITDLLGLGDYEVLRARRSVEAEAGQGVLDPARQGSRLQGRGRLPEHVAVRHPRRLDPGRLVAHGSRHGDGARTRVPVLGDDAVGGSAAGGAPPRVREGAPPGVVADDQSARPVPCGPAEPELVDGGTRSRVSETGSAEALPVVDR